MFKIIGLILASIACLFFVSCSSSEAEPEKKMSRYQKFKCKILNNNDDCD